MLQIPFRRVGIMAANQLGSINMFPQMEQPEPDRCNDIDSRMLAKKIKD